MTMMKISISLPSEMVEDMRAEIRAGRYASMSEIIREAIREWRKRYPNPRDFPKSKRSSRAKRIGGRAK